MIRNYEELLTLTNIDNFANILFHKAFKELNLDTQTLEPTSPLVSFNRQLVTMMWIILLLVIMVEKPYHRIIITDFVVVKTLITYNVILGRPTFNALEYIVFTFHLKVKFPMKVGVGVMIQD